MRRFGLFVCMGSGVAMVLSLFVYRVQRDYLTFPVLASTRPNVLPLRRCLVSEVYIDHSEFPPWWRSRRLLLDSTVVPLNDSNWLAVEKPEPEMPGLPAIWRFAGRDSIDFQALSWPVGFRVRLSLRDSVQRGRLIMTDDAGNSWVPKGSWRFAFESVQVCGPSKAI